MRSVWLRRVARCPVPPAGASPLAARDCSGRPPHVGDRRGRTARRLDRPGRQRAGAFVNAKRRAAGLAGGIAILLLASASTSCSTAGRNDLRGPAAGAERGARTGVAVRVMFQDAALAGASVAWRESLRPGEPPVFSGTTDGAGTVFCPLGPGRYFLVGQWRRDGDFLRPIAPGDRFAYFGGNPVFVSGGLAREIVLPLEEFASPPEGLAPPAGLSGVAGVVLSGGVPVADAQVFAYLRGDGAFRDLGFAASGPTAADGRFVLDLPPGAYYLVARRRAAGGVAGPLRKGDAFGYFAANPVTVVPGRFSRVAIPMTVLKLRNIPAWSGDYAAAASIEGRILGRDGTPRRGVYAALYDNPDLLNRPVFLSDVTGPDGRYRLPVPAPGTYYLGARVGYGGSPAPGGLYGRYEGSPDHSVTVREGSRLTGIDIVVDEVR